MKARFFALVALVLGLDLATKAWASHALAHAPHAVVEGRLSLVLAHNPHGAMGLLREAGADARRVILVAVTTLASVVMIELARRTKPHERSVRAGLALILGGALGNLIDRVLHGVVVDFIDVTLMARGIDGATRATHWPTFNVADIAIVVGAVLVALQLRAASGTPATLSRRTPT